MADRTLVYGARSAAQAGGDGDLAAAKSATDTADFLAEGVSTVVQARNRHFNSAMKAELAKTGELSDEEYKKLEKEMRKKRFGYVFLNKRGRVAMEQEVTKQAENIEKTKDLNDKIANANIEDPDRDLGGCNTEAITNIVGGKTEVVYDENGNPGYNMPTGRECFAAEQEELKEFVNIDEEGEASLDSYKEAWDDDRFTTTDDGKFKVDKFGNKYPNTEEGFQTFVDASEEWWKSKDDETQQKRGLDIDSQTGERSTHPAFQKRRSSPMKMVGGNQETEDKTSSGEEGEKQKKKGNFMSFSDIENMVNEAAVDEKSFQAIEAIVANAAVDGEQKQIGEDSNFKYKSYFNNIKQQIVSKGNLRSLAQNTNTFGRSFEKDLAEAIMTASYEELGVGMGGKDRDQLESMDPTPRTPITSRDAQVIVKRVLQDRELLVDYVTEYYTNFAEQNFNNSLKPEVASNFDYKLTLDEAQVAARRRFGPDRNFTYKGGIYSTNTPEDTAKDENEFA